MITLIGTSTTIIGFGLCGIDRVIEVTRETSKQQISRHIEQAQSPIIMIDEALLEGITTDKILIPIPDRHSEPQDRLDELVQDVIGIKGN